MKITFWNIHGLPNLSQCPAILKHDVIAACETWSTYQQNPIYLNNFQSYWANATREHLVGRPSGGLVTAICKEYCSEVLEDPLDHFKTLHNYDIIILGGDMNAKVGQADLWLEEIFNGLALNKVMSTTDHATCDRGIKLLEFMGDNNFVLINGRTDNDTPAQPTFDERGSSIIDLIWVNVTCLHYILDLEVLIEPTLSVHRPVCLSINIEVSSQDDTMTITIPRPITK
ncbi:Protein of unknown function, partial [Cotesia congregata]